MIEQFFEAVEHGVSYVMSKLKGDINDYCDLETTSGANLVAKDGSIGTVLRYGGYRSLLGREEFQGLVNDFTSFSDVFLGRRGHSIQVVFSRENDPTQEIRRILAPMYETAEALQLDVTDILDEKVAVHAHHCMDEQTYFVLWTTKAVLSPDELKLSRAEQAALRQQHNIPPMQNAQDILRPLRFLEERHDTFVKKVVDELTRMHCAVDIVDAGEAICQLSRFLYRSRPYTWRPVLLGNDGMIARWKENKRMHDISETMYPRLDDQIFKAPAEIGKRQKKGVDDGGLTDTRAVRIADRIFAPVGVKIPASKEITFEQLFMAMNNAGVEVEHNGRRSMQRVPYAISFLIEGDGLRAMDLKATIAGVLSMGGAGNRNLAAAVSHLRRYRDAAHATVVKMQVMAVTWADQGEQKVLSLRRSKLSGALEGWGNSVAEEEFGDPLEALMSVVPAMSRSSIAASSAPPLSTAVRWLPLGRPVSPMPAGSTLFRTLDGKLLPYEFFSAEQDTWISLYYGGPGSGKSVLANRLNTEMCLMGGLQRLPWIGVIDIGISSYGFIKQIEDALPESLRHLAVYRRLQNTREYAMNQGDTPLGMRMPLPRDREVLKNFLVLSVTPPERGTAHTFMPEFVTEVIKQAYIKCSDKEERGNPKRFSIHANAKVAKAVEAYGIEHHEGTTWWNIVDALFDHGLYYEASVAQRYAVPTFNDFMREGGSPEIKDSFRAHEDVIEEFGIMMRAFDLEIFKGETNFDLGESRVMALDLQDVVMQGSPSARKSSTLMYMASINAFTKKFSVIKEDLELIPEKYRSYHARRIEEYSEDYKRLFVDEYHKTGPQSAKGVEHERFASLLRESILVFGRESRKWMLEIALASQFPNDFAELANLATSVFILDRGNESTRKDIRTIFGLNDTEEAALRRFVTGAKPGVGATFLAKIKTKNGDLSRLMTATSGGLELWALSTTGEDRALRNRLYEEMPTREARRMLKLRFPSGTCKGYVMAERTRARSDGAEGFVDEDLDRSIIQRTAQEVVREWRLEQNSIGALV